MTAAESGFPKLWCELAEGLVAEPSTDSVFNQYRDLNDDVDLPDAAAIRTENLRRYMAETIDTATILVVGEAAGPWGCRFSGVPFTGEKQLLDPCFPIHGRRSSREDPRCDKPPNAPFVSKSAEAFWGVMQCYHGRFLAWDACPFQSHERDDVLTVRNPTKAEVLRLGGALLRRILEYKRFARIVAIGRKAEEVLAALEERPTYVRHPSRGGKERFADGMRVVFKNHQ